MGKNSDIASMFCAPKTLSSCVLRHWNLLENRIFFFFRTCTNAGPQEPCSPVGCLWQGPQPVAAWDWFSAVTAGVTTVARAQEH